MASEEDKSGDGSADLELDNVVNTGDLRKRSSGVFNSEGYVTGADGQTTEEKVASSQVDQLLGVGRMEQILVKSCYGMGEAGLYMISSIQGFYLSTFFLEVAQISATLAGVILLVSEVFDGIMDPIVGKLSDQTRTRWGRRRPWLLFGAFPLSLFFWILFTVPGFTTPWMVFVFYMSVAVVFKFFYAGVAVPYTALTPEITMDYDQRTSLTMWRMILGMIGSIVGATGHAILVGLLKTTDENGVEDMRFAYMVSIGLWSLIAFILVMITATSTKETLPRELMTSEHSFSRLLRESKSALLTREFLSVTAMYALSWIAINFLQGNLFLYIKYVVHDEDNFSIYLLVIQGVAILSMAMWKIVSNKTGKRKAALIGYSILIPTCIGFGFLQEDQMIIALILCFTGGLGLSNMLLMPWSMLPDVMELDEIRCGHRREGLFYSWFVFVQKIGIGLGLGFSSLLLGWVGYVAPSDQGTVDTQPPQVVLALRCIISIVPAALLILGAIAVLLFPISRASHALAAEQVMNQRKLRLGNEDGKERESDPDLVQEIHE